MQLRKLTEIAAEAARRLPAQTTLHDLVNDALARPQRLAAVLKGHCSTESIAIELILSEVQDPAQTSWLLSRRVMLGLDQQPETVAAAFLLSLIADTDRSSPDWVDTMARRYGCLRAIHIAASAPLPRQVVATVDPLSLDLRTDIPASRPSRQTIGVKSGIRNAKVDLLIPGPALGGAHERREAIATILCELSPDQSGAHMSRMQQALLPTIDYPDALSACLGLATSTCQSQASNWSSVRLDFEERVTWSADSAGASVQTGTPVKWTFTCTVGHGRVDATIGAEFAILNVCPCTAMYANLKGSGTVPGFSHVQPGKLTVTLADSIDRMMAPPKLFAAVQSVAHLRHYVLKRPMEHALVESAFDLPQFSEDIVRQAALAVASVAAGSNYLTVEAALDESIHPHVASSSVENWVSQFWMNP